MNRDNYEVCEPLDDIDNAWMQYYDKLWDNDKNTEADDRKYDRIGDKYTDNPGWYYQWCNEEKRYYVVVDRG